MCCFSDYSSKKNQLMIFLLVLFKFLTDMQSNLCMFRSWKRAGLEGLKSNRILYNAEPDCTQAVPKNVSYYKVYFERINTKCLWTVCVDKEINLYLEPAIYWNGLFKVLALSCANKAGRPQVCRLQIIRLKVHSRHTLVKSNDALKPYSDLCKIESALHGTTNSVLIL